MQVFNLKNENPDEMKFIILSRGISLPSLCYGIKDQEARGK
jgi:hypothetical protein